MNTLQNDRTNEISFYNHISWTCCGNSKAFSLIAWKHILLHNRFQGKVSSCSLFHNFKIIHSMFMKLHFLITDIGYITPFQWGWTGVVFTNLTCTWYMAPSEQFGNLWPGLTYARHSWPLSSEDSLACHTNCDTGNPFIMVISEDPWHLDLLLSV